MTHVVILSYHDRSGIQAVFGPYDTLGEAEAAMAELADWPMSGLWEIKPCRFVAPPALCTDFLPRRAAPHRPGDSPTD